MKIFVAGAAGIVGRYLIPALIEDGHQVTGSTRSPDNSKKIRALGATPAIADGLDRESVLKAVAEARPEVVIHEMTALTNLKDFRHFDKEFAVTNELRARGTDYLLEAARQAGATRFIAQSYASWADTGGSGKGTTEDGPIDLTPPREQRESVAAIRHLESVVMDNGGIALRYGGFYGHGASDDMLDLIRKRRFPVVGGGTGVWSFCEVTDAVAATVAAVTKGGPGIYNVVDDEPAPVAEWLPYLAGLLGARPPMRVPSWVGRALAGEVVVAMMTQMRGSSNAKAKRELGWTPRYASWREGFREWVTSISTAA
jgi:nucleoside-diphosphate-sugar epimerase